MKQFTHAWLAMMAMKRIERAQIPAKQQEDAKALITWFKNYRDFVLQGAWYPDFVFKDMSSSHICKYAPVETLVYKQPPVPVVPDTADAADAADAVEPDPEEQEEEKSEEVSASAESLFRKMPPTLQVCKYVAQNSKLYGKPFVLNRRHNLCDRVESFTESLIDSFKMLTVENGGSPVVPSNNHIALRFFILSHYIADGHMPLHCDARSFYKQNQVHGFIEDEWDKMVRESYLIDEPNNRFFYDKDGYPLKQQELSPLMQYVEEDLEKREFYWPWGAGCGNTWDYMSGITQYSYLMAYELVPAYRPPQEISKDYYMQTEAYQEHFLEYSKLIMGDAVESIAKIWLHAWGRYRDWFRDHELSYLKKQHENAKKDLSDAEKTIAKFPDDQRKAQEKVEKALKTVAAKEANLQKGKRTDKKQEDYDTALRGLQASRDNLAKLETDFNTANENLPGLKSICQAAQIAVAQKEAQIKRIKDSASGI